MKKEKKNKQGHVSIKMQKKLVQVFILVFLSFVGLSWRLYAINRDSGGDYKKQVMSQQQVASRVLPFRRGDIVDRKGSKLAYSEKVYNLVVDAKLMHSEEGIHLEPTLRAMEQCFPSINMPKIREYVMENPGSRYKIFAKKLTLDEITPFRGIMDGTVSFNKAEDEGSVTGVWFEEDYQRRYPYGSLAGDVLGFVQGGNTGFFGLEEYYNDTLNGVNGRQYGYMNEDSVMEEKVRPAEDGNTIVSTIDTNIQSIVEKHIRIFAETHENEYREGPAADNIGVIVMNPNNGEIYAMAGYPVFDLNHPTDMSGIDLKWYMPKTPSANVLPAEPEEPGGDPEVGVEPHEATDPENTGVSQNEPQKRRTTPKCSQGIRYGAISAYLILLSRVLS